MFLAHGPAGYIANEVIQKKEIKKLKFHEQLIVGVCSVLFGIFPDIDLLIIKVFPLPDFYHHSIFSHTPFFYLIFFGLLWGLSRILFNIFNTKTKKVLNENLINILLKTFLIGTMSHLLADMLVSNIMLLYPITTRSFTIFKYFLEPSLASGLAFSTMFAIEILIVAVFVYMVIKKYLKKIQWIDTVSKSLIVLSSFYLLFTFTFSLFTYNSSYMYSDEGKLHYDIDMDGLKDTIDLDVDNDGIDNFNDLEPSEISKRARYICESNKLAVGGAEGLVEDIKLTYGALDSYSLILQTCFDLHSPITPVLKDYYATDSYIFEYSNPELLKQYMNENDHLIELNKEADVLLAEGKIFFINDTDNNIQNLGITLDNNQLAIVLDTDERLQLHTYEEVLSKYDDIKIEIQK